MDTPYDTTMRSITLRMKERPSLLAFLFLLINFSPFANMSLFGVAGIAETFPSFSDSGPFLLDVPGFQVPSDSIVPPQLWSSSRLMNDLLNYV